MASRTSLRWWSPGTTSWLLIRTLWPSWSSRITTDSPRCPNSNRKTLTMSSRSSQTVCTCRIRTWPLKDSGYTGRHGKARCLYPELVGFRQQSLVCVGGSLRWRHAALLRQRLAVFQPPPPPCSNATLLHAGCYSQLAHSFMGPGPPPAARAYVTPVFWHRVKWYACYRDAASIGSQVWTESRRGGRGGGVFVWVAAVCC